LSRRGSGRRRAGASSPDRKVRSIRSRRMTAATLPLWATCCRRRALALGVRLQAPRRRAFFRIGERAAAVDWPARVHNCIRPDAAPEGRRRRVSSVSPCLPSILKSARFRISQTSSNRECGGEGLGVIARGSPGFSLASRGGRRGSGGSHSRAAGGCGRAGRRSRRGAPRRT